jgi:hypothetical protein
MYLERVSNVWRFLIQAGQTQSSAYDLSSGNSGLLIVTDPDLVGKQLNFIASDDPKAKSPAKFADSPLLATPITLVLGANPLSTTHADAMRAMKWVKAQVNTSPASDSYVHLLWKS